MSSTQLQTGIKVSSGIVAAIFDGRTGKREGIHNGLSNQLSEETSAIGIVRF
jgi:hypothetical protein